MKIRYPELLAKTPFSDSNIEHMKLLISVSTWFLFSLETAFSTNIILDREKNKKKRESSEKEREKKLKRAGRNRNNFLVKHAKFWWWSQTKKCRQPNVMCWWPVGVQNGSFFSLLDQQMVRRRRRQLVHACSPLSIGTTSSARGARRDRREGLPTNTKTASTEPNQVICDGLRFYFFLEIEKGRNASKGEDNWTPEKEKQGKFGFAIERERKTKRDSNFILIRTLISDKSLSNLTPNNHPHKSQLHIFYSFLKLWYFSLLSELQLKSWSHVRVKLMNLIPKPQQLIDKIFRISQIPTWTRTANVKCISLWFIGVPIL